ncbi:hypothetical protein [Streptomyces sp. NBC_01538]|uniref:hypothetical protein n=1 Tax=Streptomyces sp. NBC_01538 TaxID=2903897 RepID=UPI00386E7052
MPEHEYNSPTGKRVYDLRHACLTTWLSNCVPPAQIAEWAGNSVPVLLATYARCITGQLAALQKRIEGPQRLPPVSPEQRGLTQNFGKNTRQEPCRTGPNRTTALDSRESDRPCDTTAACPLTCF